MHFEAASAQRFLQEWNASRPCTFVSAYEAGALKTLKPRYRFRSSWRHVVAGQKRPRKRPSLRAEPIVIGFETRLIIHDSRPPESVHCMYAPCYYYRASSWRSASPQKPITANEWLTTTGSDDYTTIVPVILPCTDCAPVIIWDLPNIPDVEFTWPKISVLPSFHLPCESKCIAEIEIGH